MFPPINSTLHTQLSFLINWMSQQSCEVVRMRDDDNSSWLQPPNKLQNYLGIWAYPSALTTAPHLRCCCMRKTVRQDSLVYEVVPSHLAIWVATPTSKAKARQRLAGGYKSSLHLFSSSLHLVSGTSSCYVSFDMKANKLEYNWILPSKITCWFEGRVDNVP